MTKIICSILITLFSLNVCAQFEKIETDRPGETNIPGTVLKKWLQLETGFLRQTEKINPEKDYYFQHPSLLTKYGVTKRVELRLITNLATIKQGSINGYSTITGIDNVQLGGKINFLQEKGLRPKTSLIGHYSFRRFRTLYKDSIDGANFRFAMLHTLSKTISIGYNIGMNWNRFGSPPAYVYTFSPRFNISEKWFAYIEVFGSFRRPKKYDPENNIGAGFAYYVNDNFKIDASAGFGLSKEAPDKFYSIGASFRFKTGNN
ncbi:MAG TPA: transporter [Ferruginibacter sp.]|nr:transporter [Ferruginibacter sp.]